MFLLSLMFSQQNQRRRGRNRFCPVVEGLGSGGEQMAQTMSTHVDKCRADSFLNWKINYNWYLKIFSWSECAWIPNCKPLGSQNPGKNSCWSASQHKADVLHGHTSVCLLGVVVHACDLTTYGAKAREYKLWGQPGLHSELKVNLSYLARPVSKNQKLGM
jgi:hypothetical protein